MRPIERTYSSVIRPVEGAASEALDDALGGAALHTAKVLNKAAAAAYRIRVTGGMTLPFSFFAKLRSAAAARSRKELRSGVRDPNNPCPS